VLNDKSRRLVLAHFWIAFIAFVGALLLGEWQMWMRSPLHAWLGNPDLYYRSVTAHGSAMGYVFPTLVAMGFGYAIVGLSLKQSLIGMRWAWAGFILVVLGTVCAMVPVSMGLASVLYTFYPPMIGNPFFYLGIVLVVIGSWIWVALMSINLHAWKKAHPGAPIPLPMFANVAGAYLWAWTSIGAAIEILFQILPAAVGLTTTIDAGLARIFFSWTLHAIVYFWLMPAYIAFYTLVPRAIGGRLYSDVMARISFVLFLVFSMPIGVHHLFQDPQVGAGIKFVHAVFTGMVSIPTFLTVFTICASIEIAGRLRGGRGLLGWVTALPWKNPMMLAVAFSFVMLGFGGAGGLINMSYQLDFAIHNTQWITGHFHLIFGGAIVIMYFAIAYDLWPDLTGRALPSGTLMRTQLWLWFTGMIVMTFPWHYVGILGMPRRMAYYDYTDPALAPMALPVIITLAGGLLLVVSGLLFVVILLRAQFGRSPAMTGTARAEGSGGIPALPEFRFSQPVHMPARLPIALNSFGLWLALMIGLTLTNYGFPIAQLLAQPQTSVPAVMMKARP
jgi:cytochrome c oxidase subunit 1